MQVHHRHAHRGEDVTKFKSVQNSFFGRNEGNQLLVEKGHSEFKINLDQVVLVLNKASKLFLFLSWLGVTVAISVACHVVAGDSNLRIQIYNAQIKVHQLNSSFT